MQFPYPSGPGVVPADLTAATPAYRRHAWLAVLSLLGFIALYLALFGWLALTAWRLGSAVLAGSAHNPLLAGLVAFGAGFLAIFMAKALVFIKRGSNDGLVEIKAAEQPQLFGFLQRLADDAGAPRPHRVFVSARVNAAVFYDLSILNLLLPSRKNLEIGLGLVNVLNLSEFKAVLAHEFGHFAQRTMAVGRWVYVAQQIAAHLIERRDALDTFLLGLSRIDLRVAWIGWALRLVIWSIRSLVELLFRGVVLAQLALSREMEYQADLVATSLSGSDALVHALHKLGAADDAWQRAIDFAATQAGRGRSVSDLCAIQSRIIEQMRVILADPGFGDAPALPGGDRSQHRVFKGEIAQPPKMWATHPANSDREQNVKRRYLSAEIDGRSAWTLFADAESLRAKVSRSVFRERDSDPLPAAETLQLLDQAFSRPSLDRRYRGSFLGRSIVRQVTTPEALYEAVPAGLDLDRELTALYNDAHDADLDRYRELSQERAALQALRDGNLSAPGGVVRWRGTDRPRRELPALLAEVQAEVDAVETRITAHDRRCRSLHLRAAEALNPHWALPLRGLLATLHYAEHVSADIGDAAEVLAHTFRVVTADKNVSDHELKRLLESANVLQAALARVYAQKDDLRLGAALLQRLEVPSWAAALGELKLPVATKDNINSWLQAVDSWIQSTRGALSGLARESLELLLEVEDQVAKAWTARQPLGDAPAAPQVPFEYATLTPGQQRQRADRLSAWDRFQLADGWWAGSARFAVAAGIVGSVLFLGDSSGSTLLHLHNGLATAVVVDVNGKEQTLPAGAIRVTEISGTEHRIRTRTNDGVEIEAFDASSPSAGQVVYNVAGALPLVEWTMIYGEASAPPERVLGAPRWVSSGAEHIFTDPPETISSKGKGSTRSVLSAIDNPWNAMNALGDSDDSKAVRAAHARWDAPNSRNIVLWLSMASSLPEFRDILLERLAHNPADIPAARALQDQASGPELDQLCAERRAAAVAQPDSADAAYLALRCNEGPAQNAAWQKAHRRWPDHPWIQYAHAMGTAEDARWDEAAVLLEVSTSQLPPMDETSRAALLRIWRLQGGDRAREQRLIGGTTYLRHLVDKESGEGWAPESGIHAFGPLSRGELAEAERLGTRDPDYASEVKVIVAASAGALPAQIEAGLAAAADAEVSDAARWYAVALALRERADPSAALAKLRESAGPEAAAMERFLQRLAEGTSAEQALAELGPIDVVERGIAYASAAVLLGPRCPATWRKQAKALLFKYERPYLG